MSKDYPHRFNLTELTASLTAVFSATRL